MEILFGLVGNEDFDTVKDGFFERENGLIGGRDGEAAFADLPRIEHERAVFVRKDIRDFLLGGIDGKMVDVDVVVVFFNIDSNVGFRKEAA